MSAPRAVVVVGLALALLGCRDRASGPGPTRRDAAVGAPATDPRPRPAAIAHLTLKVLGMT